MRKQVIFILAILVVMLANPIDAHASTIPHSDTVPGDLERYAESVRKGDNSGIGGGSRDGRGIMGGITEGVGRTVGGVTRTVGKVVEGVGRITDRTARGVGRVVKGIGEGVRKTGRAAKKGFQSISSVGGKGKKQKTQGKIDEIAENITKKRNDNSGGGTGGNTGGKTGGKAGGRVKDANKKPPEGVGVKKPNIYLYPQSATQVKVAFTYPKRLTAVIPDYSGIWSVMAHPDGTLANNEGPFSYLFYEADIAPSLFQTHTGWLVKDGERVEKFNELLSAYGLNKQEKADFIEYWCDELEPGIDYRMYPQTTDAVDAFMPVTVTPVPDSTLRLWFAFEAVEKGGSSKQLPPEPQIKPLVRNGFTLVEWGGAILP